MFKVTAALAVFATVMAAYFAFGSQVDAASEIYQSGKSKYGVDLAVGGFDAVAYHSDAKATLGKAGFEHQWKGAAWRFASAENFAAFKAAPVKYASQYGGYCAYGMAKGYPAHGDPRHWTVVDGKLYLNYSAGVRNSWTNGAAGYIAAADAAWPNIPKK